MDFLLAADPISTGIDLATRAGTESGWMAVALVVIVTAALGLFAYFLRGDKSEARETQRFIRTEMADVIDGNTIVVGRLIATMRDRPCLHDSDLTRLEGNGTHVSEKEVGDLDDVTKRAVVRVQRREQRRQRRSAGDEEETPG